MKPKSNAYPWRWAAFFMCYYAANAAYQGYISKYYQSAGATNAQISLLLAAAPVVTVLAQPVWGALGDRARSRNRLLRVLILVSAAFMALLPISKRFVWLMALGILFPAFYTSIQPMGDSIILENLTRRGEPFGLMRLTGCLSFAVFNLCIGYAVGGRYLWIILLTVALLLATFGASFCLPATPGHRRRGEKISMLDVFRLKGVAGLMALFMMLQLCLGYFYSFFSIHFTSLPGGTSGLLGLAYFISASSETPFLLLSDKLFDKLGAGRLMCISALTMLVRWTVLASCTNVAVVLVSQLLHGWGFIVMTVSMAKYINAVVPDALKSSGQMLISIGGYGIARTFGILGGGLLSDVMGGTRQGFILTAVIAGLALILFAPHYLRQPPLNGKNEA